ncbi:hypothetical protein NL676_003526 [Syzygium grande]|nr:hypothetical protein NL676_003526 [Syzygium grande]
MGSKGTFGWAGLGHDYLVIKSGLAESSFSPKLAAIASPTRPPPPPALLLSTISPKYFSSSSSSSSSSESQPPPNDGGGGAAPPQSPKQGRPPPQSVPIQPVSYAAKPQEVPPPFSRSSSIDKMLSSRRPRRARPRSGSLGRVGLGRTSVT